MGADCVRSLTEDSLRRIMAACGGDEKQAAAVGRMLTGQVNCSCAIVRINPASDSSDREAGQHVPR